MPGVWSRTGPGLPNLTIFYKDKALILFVIAFNPVLSAVHLTTVVTYIWVIQNLLLYDYDPNGHIHNLTKGILLNIGGTPKRAKTFYCKAKSFT